MSGLSFSEADGREYQSFEPDIEKLKMKSFDRPDIHRVFEKILMGSMPKVVSKEAERERYYQDYVNIYP